MAGHGRAVVEGIPGARLGMAGCAPCTFRVELCVMTEEMPLGKHQLTTGLRCRRCQILPYICAAGLRAEENQGERRQKSRREDSTLDEVEYTSSILARAALVRASARAHVALPCLVFFPWKLHRVHGPLFPLTARRCVAGGRSERCEEKRGKHSATGGLVLLLPAAWLRSLRKGGLQGLRRPEC